MTDHGIHALGNLAPGATPGVAAEDSSIVCASRLAIVAATLAWLPALGIPIRGGRNRLLTQARWMAISPEAVRARTVM
jgi:hypothetical protein